MTRPSAFRCSVALAATAALVLLASGGPAVTLASPAHRAGPGELVRQAGAPMGGESEPDAAVDANIADLPTADNQQHFADQAAALPGAFPGLKWQNVGPLGQDDPADSPNGALRFARNAGMGAAIAVDPRDPSGDSFYVGTMGGLWYTTNGGENWTSLSTFLQGEPTAERARPSICHHLDLRRRGHGDRPLGRPARREERELLPVADDLRVGPGARPARGAG